MSDANAQLTGRDLDRAIAERLGYTVRQAIADDDHLYFAAGTPVFCLVDPRGVAVDLFDFILIHEIIDTEDHAWRSAPVFHADANVTLAACTECGWYLSFTGNSALIAYDIGGGFSRTHRGDGATPQEAAARALLAALSDARAEGQG